MSASAPSLEHLQAQLERLRLLPGRPVTLEQLVCSDAYFGLTTATPLQRAIVRLADGRSLGGLIADPAVIAGLGAVQEVSARPKEVLLLSGIRAGKSLLAAALAVHWSQTCDVSNLRDGEVPRIPVLSLRLDLAQVVYDHIVGTVLSRPRLKALLLEDPTGDTVLLRHPSGRPIEIRVTAGARAGSSLVARWLAGVIFDEAPLMQGQDDAVINYDEAREQALGRILPGGQIVSIGSPWAPFGPIYERYVTHFGKPTADIVVVKAPGWDMNPLYWTPERCEDLKRSNPDAYATTCAAEFRSPEESLFTSVEIDRATRAAPSELPYSDRLEYIASMDPATRGNAWTFCIATRVGRMKHVVLVRQWTGSRLDPLSPRAVLAEIAKICHGYHVTQILSDQWFGDALRDLAKAEGLTLWQISLTERERTEKYMNLRTKVAEGEVDLPPDPMVRADLQRVKKRTTQSGVSIVLPKTSDGRHCDYAPALLLALNQWLTDERPLPIEPGTKEAMALEASRMLKAQQRRFAPKKRSR